MSDFSFFMKEHKKKRNNEKYAPTATIVGADGKPVEWEFQHLTSKQVNEIRDNFTTSGFHDGQYTTRVDTNRFVNALIAESTVYPDLRNAELQDSYGVKTPEDLVYELVDDPGEYAAFTEFMQRFLGFSDDNSLENKIDVAKN